MIKYQYLKGGPYKLTTGLEDSLGRIGHDCPLCGDQLRTTDDGSSVYCENEGCEAIFHLWDDLYYVTEGKWDELDAAAYEAERRGRR